MICLMFLLFFFLMRRRPPRSTRTDTLFPTRRSSDLARQALEADALARHVEPVVQVRVVGDQLLHLGIGPVDVLGVPRQRRPAERPDAAAEQRPEDRKSTRLNSSH